jgi:toxin-antitoxin system PIN domain toxin
MIAIDTNILVYAHRNDSPFNDKAKACLKNLAESRTSWAIPVHCLTEFYAVVTHAKIWKTPSTPEQASRQIIAWRRSPSLVIIGDDKHSLELLLDMARQLAITGPRIHDARIAAVCLNHGINELWTIDRDFTRFTNLKTKNPL